MEQSSDTSVATSPQQPMQTQIPDLVKIGSIPSSTQMDIETSILEPVQHSQSTCRFVLENKGLLHSNSKLVFSVTDPAGTNNAYFPINIGVFSLIRSARLMSGGKVLSEVQDQNVLTAYESMFISNEHNVEKEIFSTGRMMNHNFEYDISTSGTKSAGVIVDTHMDYDGAKYLIPSFVEASAESEFQINLSDLFPLLKQQQLPLFMMKEQVTVELEFEPNAGRMWTSATEAQTFNIDTSSTKFVADYIYYPAEMMTAYANANKDLTLTYMNYRLSKTTIDAGTELKVRNVGGNGRIVTKIIAGLQDDSIAFGANMFGKYSSLAPAGAANANGSIKLNVKYNNHLLYPIDVSNYAQHQHHLAQAQGMVPFVTRYEYCGEGTNLSVPNDDLEGSNLRTTLVGRFCWQAHRLNRNERVNSRGIEYETTYTTNGGSRTQRVYLEMVRLATLSDGVFTVIDA
jgi:hypothetical protein